MIWQFIRHRNVQWSQMTWMDDDSITVWCIIIYLCVGWLQFYLQDTKSSNGTFVNSHRLSKGSEESMPYELFSSDTVQFGVDVMENSRKGTTTCFYCVTERLQTAGSALCRFLAVKDYMSYSHVGCRPKVSLVDNTLMIKQDKIV